MQSLNNRITLRNSHSSELFVQQWPQHSVQACYVNLWHVTFKKVRKLKQTNTNYCSATSSLFESGMRCGIKAVISYYWYVCLWLWFKPKRRLTIAISFQSFSCWVLPRLLTRSREDGMQTVRANSKTPVCHCRYWSCFESCKKTNLLHIRELNRPPLKRGEIYGNNCVL